MRPATRRLAALLLSTTTLLPFAFSLLPSPPALAQATDPRKEAADRVLKPCWEHLQQHPTMMVMI